MVACRGRSTRPSLATSWSDQGPGMRETGAAGRRGSPRAGASRPASAAVNQTSRPSADQARPPQISPARGQGRLLPGGSTTTTAPRASPQHRVVDERDRSPSGEMRGWVMLPAARGGPSRSGTRAARATRSAHHREATSVGAPVGLAHVVEDLAGRAPAHGHAGQRAAAAGPGRLQRDGHLAGRARPGQQRVLADPSERESGLPGCVGEDLRGPALPPGAVDDRPSVGREARGLDGAAPEGQRLERGDGRVRASRGRREAPATRERPRPAPAAAGFSHRAGRRPRRARRPGADCRTSASRANAMSRADWKRSSGLFSRQCRRSARARAGSLPVGRDEVRRVLLEDRVHGLHRRVAAEGAPARRASRRARRRTRRCPSAGRPAGPRTCSGDM